VLNANGALENGQFQRQPAGRSTRRALLPLDGCRIGGRAEEAKAERSYK